MLSNLLMSTGFLLIVVGGSILYPIAKKKDSNKAKMASYWMLGIGVVLALLVPIVSFLRSDDGSRGTQTESASPSEEQEKRVFEDYVLEVPILPEGEYIHIGVPTSAHIEWHTNEAGVMVTVNDMEEENIEGYTPYTSIRTVGFRATQSESKVRIVVTSL